MFIEAYKIVVFVYINGGKLQVRVLCSGFLTYNDVILPQMDTKSQDDSISSSKLTQGIDYYLYISDFYVSTAFPWFCNCSSLSLSESLCLQI